MGETDHLIEGRLPVHAGFERRDDGNQSITVEIPVLPQPIEVFLQLWQHLFEERAILSASVYSLNCLRHQGRLDGYCQEFGRDLATVRRTVLAYRPIVDPLSSIDAFDEYVGRYREIGIDEVIFYWPPLDNLHPRRPGSTDDQPVFDPPRSISPAQQATFERIAVERVANN